MDNPKNILITGGVGYLGVYLANYFLKRGYGIRIFDICDYAASDYTGAVEYFKGDIRDYESLFQAVCGTDFIIHAASELPFKKRRDIFSTSVKGTENLLRAAKENKTNRLIYMSSTAVYGLHKNMPIGEEATFRGITDHARSKILAEQSCALCRKQGMNVTILRPAPIIGEGKLGFFQILYDWIKEDRKIPVVGSGQNRFQMLEAQDLCEAIQAIINAPAYLVNTDFNVGAAVFGTINEDLNNFIKEVGSKSRLIHFPANGIKIILKIFEKIKISSIYEGVYGVIDKDLYFSIEKINRELGCFPKKSNVDALVKGYRWYIDNKNKRIKLFSNANNRSVFKQGAVNLIKKAF
ncbi:MAG: NAD-dependent epimerase/dehydratase family protein [Candidatus Omnitrophota bacterium]|jgi:nucleoside-diphosphate-sugar epimerase